MISPCNCCLPARSLLGWMRHKTSALFLLPRRGFGTSSKVHTWGWHLWNIPSRAKGRFSPSFARVIPTGRSSRFTLPTTVRKTTSSIFELVMTPCPMRQPWRMLHSPTSRPLLVPLAIGNSPLIWELWIHVNLTYLPLSSHSPRRKSGQPLNCCLPGRRGALLDLPSSFHAHAGP